MSLTISEMSSFSRATGLRAVVLATLVALVAGCSGSGTTAPPSASGSTAVTATIGTGGGTVTGPDGVQVVIPPGALSSDTIIGIARTSAGAPATLPDGSSPAGGIYEFTPHDLVFRKPVTIRMPIPPNGVGVEVFMASLGAEWQINDARVAGGFAEWERNSFSFGMVPACALPAGDLYPCVYPKGYAMASATPTTAITRQTSGFLGTDIGSAGSWVVNGAGALTLTLNYEAAPDCIVPGPDGARAKLLRWNPDVPVNSPNRGLQTLFDGPVGLVLTTFPIFGGGSYDRLTGSTSVPVPSSALTDATNAFGFTFSCQRPGKSRHTGGDFVTIIGPMAAPVGASTISVTVSGLTGTGLVLHNGSDNLPVPTDGTFTFPTAIAAGSTYSVSVLLPQPSGQTCTVANGTGTANGSPVNVAVTCVVASSTKAWQGAALLENIDLGDAYSPQVVFDANGNGMAVWTQHDGTYLRIRSVRYTPNGGWGPMVLVDNGGAMALSPKVAVDGSGNVRAVWLQSVTGTTRSIWTNLYSPASGWGTATVLEASVSSVGGNSPEIAMDPAGNATLVWSAFDGSWTSLWARRYTAGGVWSPATLIENDNNGGVGDQGVVMEANGNAMVVWSQYDVVGQRTNVLANRYVVGSGWGTPTPIEATDLNAGVSDIALDSAGNIMVVLHQQTSSVSPTTGSIYTNRFSNGSWGTATLVKSAIPYLSQSAIAMNASGNAMVVWLEDDGFDVTSIWARAYTAAGVGGATVRIDNLSRYMDGRTPQVAMDGSGNAVAVWGQGSHIWSARYVAGTGWGTPADIDNGAGGFPSNQPRIAVDASGNALAVWERPSGTFGNIWGNVFR